MGIHVQKDAPAAHIFILQTPTLLTKRKMNVKLIVALLPTIVMADIACWQNLDPGAPIKSPFQISGATACITSTYKWTGAKKYLAVVKCEDWKNPDGVYLNTECCYTDHCNAPKDQSPAPTTPAPSSPVPVAPASGTPAPTTSTPSTTVSGASAPVVLQPSPNASKANGTAPGTNGTTKIPNKTSDASMIALNFWSAAIVGTVAALL
jgi:hypothetical protein